MAAAARARHERTGKPRRRAPTRLTSPPETAAERAPASEADPSRYIARMSKRTGKEVPGPIDPDELLVHAHRDQHPAEVVAQFLGSRLVRITGREGLVEAALRGVNAVGAGAAALAGSVLGSDAVERATKRLLGVVGR